MHAQHGCCSLHCTSNRLDHIAAIRHRTQWLPTDHHRKSLHLDIWSNRSTCRCG
ncbi:uncharacterized protein HMPREF1541_10528 [Cyphellophora europaea CBS 101466]|uniref:Uncharacterized protein n=1 Tax=Cyphellophora europaea (strain CBS 101466) TaxID=1220924 RepID=W2S8H7_CYPE1|nr:uncharacterized protein HMPREF1541_10528 [Cyphellophora europaea CBS 101466]ETN44348.1 hypothetical protein HMPREF1541_10528 [Cyphellophora europaea CBS 101466]